MSYVTTYTFMPRLLLACRPSTDARSLRWSSPMTRHTPVRYADISTHAATTPFFADVDARQAL
jgi:hypothetical protein